MENAQKEDTEEASWEYPFPSRTRFPLVRLFPCEYAILAERYDRGCLDEIVGLIAETLCFLTVGNVSILPGIA